MGLSVSLKGKSLYLDIKKRKKTINRITDHFNWHLSDYLICKSKIHIKGAEYNTLIHGYVV